MKLYLKNLDWTLIISVLFLMFLSLMSLLSNKPEFFYRQIIFWVIGFLFIFLILKFDWRPYVAYRGVIFLIYLVSIFFLLITYFFAPSVRGIKGWIVLGPLQFQTSELAKLAMIIFYAYFFSHKHVSIARLSNLFASFVYFAVPAGLVALQPDFGSMLILFFLWFGFLLISGIRWRHLIAAAVIFLLAGAFMWANVLHNYQKERILGVFFPDRDPLGISYNVIQSKIAIGSAGFFGKGFKQGTQVQLGFLPEGHTDFIFAALSEEFGMLAAFLALAAFAFLILRIIKIGLDADNNFGKFICLGSVVLFVSQFVLNIGSNLGITPVIGVTFPFLSYGGSSLIVNLILMGFIQSIVIRK